MWDAVRLGGVVAVGFGGFELEFWVRSERMVSGSRWFCVCGSVSISYRATAALSNFTPPPLTSFLPLFLISWYRVAIESAI